MKYCSSFSLQGKVIVLGLAATAVVILSVATGGNCIVWAFYAFMLSCGPILKVQTIITPMLADERKARRITSTAISTLAGGMIINQFGPITYLLQIHMSPTDSILFYLPMTLIIGAIIGFFYNDVMAGFILDIWKRFTRQSEVEFTVAEKVERITNIKAYITILYLLLVGTTVFGQAYYHLPILEDGSQEPTPMFGMYAMFLIFFFAIILFKKEFRNELTFDHVQKEIDDAQKTVKILKEMKIEYAISMNALKEAGESFREEKSNMDDCTSRMEKNNLAIMELQQLRDEIQTFKPNVIQALFG